MTSDSPDNAAPLGILLGLAVGGLMLLLLVFMQAPASEPQRPIERTPTPIEQWQPRQPADSEEASIKETSAKDTAVLARQASQAPAAPQERADFPFKFLGKVTDRGKTSVVLYASGRTVTVRDTGPIDDDYAVDAIQENSLVLRHLRLGTSQTIEFTPAQPATAAAWAGGETPQD